VSTAHELPELGLERTTLVYTVVARKTKTNCPVTTAHFGFEHLLDYILHTETHSEIMR